MHAVSYFMYNINFYAHRCYFVYVADNVYVGVQVIYLSVCVGCKFVIYVTMCVFMFNVYVRTYVCTLCSYSEYVSTWCLGTGQGKSRGATTSNAG